MPNELIIEQCAPTLAGLKAANLFSYRYEDVQDVISGLRELNNTLSYKGIRFIPIQFKNDRALIFCYRKEMLKEVLSDSESVKMLEELGYSNGSLASFISQLRTRLLGESFPHEIGLFLGYPCEDVRAFMRSSRDGCQYVGTWKAYGNVERAKSAHERFRKCTKVYKRCYENGASLEKLTISSKGAGR